MEKERPKYGNIISIIIACAIILLAVAAIVYAVLFVKPSKNTNNKSLFKDNNVSEASKAQSAADDNDADLNISKKVDSSKNSSVSSSKKGTGKENTNKDNKEKDNGNESTNTVSPEKVKKVFPFKCEFSTTECKIDIFHDAKNGNRLPYRMYLPENYNPSKKYPVLVFLHSAGEVGTDTAEVPAALAAKMFEYNADLVSQAFVLCPQSYEWWNIDKQSGDRKGTLSSVVHLLDEIKKTYSCDSNRIYVTGISMGGYGTYDLIETYGDVFAAGMPMCGAGNTGNGAAFKNTPIRIYHSADDPTVSVLASRNMYNAIISAGGQKVNFFELDGLGHDITSYVFHNRDAFCWLFAQNKATNPTGKYEYIPYFRVVDSNGKTVISDEDVDDLYYVNGYEGEKYVLNVNMYLKAKGVNKLSKAYTSGSSKEFTVYWLNEKLYTYTANKAPTSDVFSIGDIFDDEAALTFSKTVLKSIEELR